MRSRLVTCGLVVIITLVHVFYVWGGGLYLYEKSGGVTTNGDWTQFGGATHAWTVPIVLPGTLLMLAEEKASGLHNPDSIGSARLGFLLVFAGEIFTAYAVASVMVSLFTGKGFSWGQFGWKAILIVLGLVWIPVPESWALVYQYTVIY